MNTTEENKIKEAYKAFICKEPDKKNLHSFLLSADIKESEFFHNFGSLRALERAVHRGSVERTIERLHEDEQYPQYSGREKMLAFCFTWFDELTDERLYLLTLAEGGGCSKKVKFLNDVRKPLAEYLKSIVHEAESNGELPQRLFLNSTYPKAALLMVSGLFKFWLRDNSAKFAQTDVAIEKSVNLFFDLTCRGPLESLADFSRFIVELGLSRS